VPELNGYTRNLKTSAEYVAQSQPELVSGMDSIHHRSPRRRRGCEFRIGSHIGKIRGFAVKLNIAGARLFLWNRRTYISAITYQECESAEQELERLRAQARDGLRRDF
jgi:hypothetical protein